MTSLSLKFAATLIVLSAYSSTGLSSPLADIKAGKQVRCEYVNRAGKTVTWTVKYRGNELNAGNRIIVENNNNFGIDEVWTGNDLFADAGEDKLSIVVHPQFNVIKSLAIRWSEEDELRGTVTERVSSQSFEGRCELL